MKIAIIGSGPSGIIAALTISSFPEQEVWLYDGNQKIGRKLFATGNGRCNITNLQAGKDSFFSRRPQDLSPVFDQYPPQKIREVLEKHGIPTTATEDGWVYPSSFSAANVVQILSDDLAFAKVNVKSNCRITTIGMKGGKFILGSEAGNEAHPFDRLIITSGSRAFPQLGANTTILSELFKFGHKDIPFSPALAPILAKGPIFRTLQGVRLDAEVSIQDADKELGQSFGNLIFTDYGLNGPVIMNLSHLIDQIKPENFKLKINFIPGDMKQQIEAIFYKRINSDYLYRSIFLSFLPDKLVEFLFDQWKLTWDTPCRRIDSRNFRIHIGKLETFLIPIDGSKGFNFGHVAAGGIPLDEIDLHTMQSKKQKGLYFAGEVLDIIGPCGGYNLTWAFASGLIAGENAAIKD